MSLVRGTHPASKPGHANDGWMVNSQRLSARVLTVGPVSPLVGQRISEVALPDPEQARIVAIIRDDTPELFEDDAVRPCAVGDRVVTAGRPDALRELRRFLLG